MEQRILHGDCAKELRKLPDASVDSVVTDPPYGLSKEPDISEVLTKWLAGEDYVHTGGGFMGKTWDSFVPGPSVWREVYRTLKPGGYALVFAGTRTQDLMTVALRLAGFEVRDVIEWLYFSGFPKSMDVGKAFDKRNGAMFPQRVELAKHIKEKRLAKGIERKAINEMLGHVAGIQHWEAQDFNNNAVPTVSDWATLKPLLALSDEFDWLIERMEAEREKVGEDTKARSTSGDSALPTMGGETIYKTWNITTPATDLAKQWDGWGTALKPAHEPIIVVRKPLIGTVADNVERYGTGALNIDGCRIATDDNLNGGAYSKGKADDGEWGTMHKFTGNEYVQPTGRFPANAITTDDDAFYSPYFNVSPADVSKKASKKDRNSDWEGNEIKGEPQALRTMGNHMNAYGSCPDHGAGLPSGGNRYACGCELVRGKPYNSTAKNNHPTVKPTDLMAWLIRLVTPPGGVVLDPYAGSGSTLVAAKREGFGFVGIEREAEYVTIIKGRTGVTHEMTDEEFDALLA